MHKSIFYNGEELTLIKSVSTDEFFKSIAETEKRKSIINISSFKKGGETLWLLEDDGDILAICRPSPKKPTGINNVVHRETVETFGEVIEVLGRPELANIFELFSPDDRSEEVFSLVESDYKGKVKNFEKHIDVRDLYYLGRESDGKIYLYDEKGNILIYAYDHPIEDDSIRLVDGQPDDTFYHSNVFKTVSDTIRISIHQE